MKLAEVKEKLSGLSQIAFKLPSGEFVAGHFHVTEVGKVSKHFIDCGGTIRTEERVCFQLWNANDYDHRLHPDKLLKIISLSEKTLELGNHEIEVEYQGNTIERYGLGFDGVNFLLLNKNTDCLAKDKCGIPEEPLQTTQASSTKCSPGAGCC